MSMTMRTPQSAIRPAAMMPCSARAPDPSRIIGFFAAFSALAISMLRAASGGMRAGAVTTGPAPLASDQVQSAGRIRVAVPQAPVWLATIASDGESHSLVRRLACLDPDRVRPGETGDVRGQRRIKGAVIGGVIADDIDDR